MPRLASLVTKLTSIGSKKTPVFIKNYTGTDFSAIHSTWTFSTGTISLKSTTLPYHSYGNSMSSTTATNQGCDRTWSLRGGINTGSGVSISILQVDQGNFFADTSNVKVNMPIVFDTTDPNVTSGLQYYVKTVSSSSFTVSRTVNGAPLTFTSSNVIIGSVSYAVSATGNIGYWINGVNIYGPSAANEAPNGYLKFNNLNYVAANGAALDYSFDLAYDLAGGRTTSNGNYHYQDVSFINAWSSGTAHVGTGTKVVTTGSSEVSNISYLSGSVLHTDGHSKILGWSLDGYPIYGPYGYNQPLDCNSGVRPMVSSYAIFSSPSLVDGRKTDGVLDTLSYPMGIFVQDYYFAGTGDLDVYNGRFCVTPEYPQGTYAYFCTINPDTGRSVYPYVIGNFHKSTPLQGSQTTSIFVDGGGIAPKQTG